MNIQQYIPEMLEELEAELSALAPRPERITFSLFGGPEIKPAETPEEFRARKERAQLGADQLKAALLDADFIKFLEASELQIGSAGGSSVYDRWLNCLGQTTRWHAKFLSGKTAQELLEEIE